MTETAAVPANTETQAAMQVGMNSGHFHGRRSAFVDLATKLGVTFVGDLETMNDDEIQACIVAAFKSPASLRTGAMAERSKAPAC